MMEEEIQIATSLATHHWEYVKNVIDEHEGWDITHYLNPRVFYLECQSAYLSGFINGYLGWGCKAAFFKTFPSEAQFHYETAYEHGREHRKQDDTKKGIAEGAAKWKRE